MGRQAVPDDEQFTRQLPHEMAQKIDDLFGFDRAVIQTKVKVPERNPGNRREIIPVEMVLEDGRLTARSPRAGPMGLLRKTAFIHEYYRPPFPAGFFLMAGHCFFFQWVIAPSFRSRARPTGRWELHPRPRRIFQTWPR